MMLGRENIKSDEYRRLDTNLTADWLNKPLQSTKPFIETFDDEDGWNVKTGEKMDLTFI